LEQKQASSRVPNVTTNAHSCKAILSVCPSLCHNG